MKVLSIILTCALLGVMGWLVIDSQSKAKGAQNQLDLLRRQQSAKSGNPADAQLAEAESQLLAEQAKRNAAGNAAPAPAPLSPSLPARTVPSPTVTPSPAASGGTPALNAAIAAANAAPLPQTPRQRMIAGAPALAEVKQFAKEYGFVEITAGSGAKIEKGMGFAIRRGNAIIARIKVTDVEASSAVADVDSKSLTPGVTIEPGDQVIQDLPPES
jgi:hypothetical protein